MPRRPYASDRDLQIGNLEGDGKSSAGGVKKCEACRISPLTMCRRFIAHYAATTQRMPRCPPNLCPRILDPRKTPSAAGLPILADDAMSPL